MSYHETQKIARALVEIGNEHIPTPPSEGTVRFECKWCRQSLTENKGTQDTRTTRLRIEHDKDCPVALAQRITTE